MEREELEREIRENGWAVHGMKIAQNGQTVEQTGDCETRFPLYSATKSILSTAVGFAVAEGRFSIDNSLYDYIHCTGMDAQRAKSLSIRRLLTMSVPGLPFRPQGENWLADSLAQLPADTQTIAFDYSNIPAYLVGVALQCALSQHIADYLQPRLFEPLGIARPDYADDPQGFFYGASGMKLSVEELSRIGELYRCEGVWKGARLLPAEWIRQATAVQIPCREGGYGFFIWKYRDGYRISGKWGQRCIVLPAQGQVITFLSDKA